MDAGTSIGWLIGGVKNWGDARTQIKLRSVFSFFLSGSLSSQLSLFSPPLVLSSRIFISFPVSV